MPKILLGKKLVARNAEIAASHLARLRGLMFRKKPVPILFEFEKEAKWQIHSFFVFFPFDAVYLDAGKKVVSVFPSIPPFTPNVSPTHPALFLLELPAGSVKKLKIKVGERLSWERKRAWVGR